MLGAELRDDLGSGRVLVAEDAVESAFAAERFDELRRKAGLRLGEISPLEFDRRAGDLPMPRLRILSRRYFSRAACLR